MLWIYTLVSVVIVSLISLISVFTLSISQEKLKKFLIYFVSLSAGTLLGDAFIHLIPESYKNGANAILAPLSILSGILVFFILEKFLHWRHCHDVACDDHPHPFSYVILMGDTLHNFIDGLVIAASYVVSIPVGLATTLAVILHEIPQEIGDFSILVHAGFSKGKALLLNFASALLAILGAVITILLTNKIESLQNFLIPITIGGFIYIAGSDLIPEL